MKNQDDFYSVLPKCKPSVCKDDLGKYEEAIE